MQTSLPDLPFTNYGKAEHRLFGVLSSSTSTARVYPRTDLEALTPWTSFPDDIHYAIQSATTRACLPPTPLHLEGYTGTRFHSTEEGLRGHAIFALHVVVEDMMERFGIDGYFELLGSEHSAKVVGNPDFLWISDIAPQPKLIVEYKCWWEADLIDLPAAFAGTSTRPLAQQSLDALHQIYGYMTFNDNKFGILTNWRRALFLRRTETLDGKTLEYYLVELDGSNDPPISMLKAWVGMVLLAKDDWFYASPTQYSAPPARNFGASKPKRKNAAEDYKMHPVNGKYQRVPFDLHLCRFDLSSARCRASGCVVNGWLLQASIGKGDLRVVFKVVDALQYPEQASTLEDEASTYAALEELQGKVIPKLYGFYEVWGILHLLALEPVGEAIPQDAEIDQTLLGKMEDTVRRLHDAGFVHGDIARRNFCRTENGNVFLVDLERCHAADDPSDLQEEMVKCRGL